MVFEYICNRANIQTNRVFVTALVLSVSMLVSAQNKGWKLVRKYYRLSLASPLEMYSKFVRIAQSYTEMGWKMTCDRSL